MHEMSLAQSIVSAVDTKATECKATHVKSVRLQVGEASGVATDSLTSCFEMLTSLDPTLAGARLLIDVVPHCARCPHCAKDFPITNYVVQCPTCKEWSHEVISGTELQIIEMEIDAF